MGRIAQRTYKGIKGMRRDIASYLLSEARRNIPYVYQLINIEPSTIEGYLQRSKGISLIVDLGINAPLQNIAFSKDNNRIAKFTAVAQGKIYNIKDWTETTPSYELKTSAVLKTSGFVDIVPCQDVTNGNTIVLLDGVTIPQSYTYGTSVSNLFSDSSTFIASTGKFINDRLWLNDVDEAELKRWSKGGDITDFTTLDDSGFLPMGNRDNPVTACHEVFVAGSTNTNILVAKEDKLWGISGKNGDSTSDYRFHQYPLNNTLGTPSPRGIIGVGQDLIVMGNNDIAQYGSALKGDGTFKVKDIFTPIRGFYKEKLNRSYASSAFLYHNQDDGRDGRIYGFLPEGSRTDNSFAFVYDRIGGWYSRNFFQYSFTCAARDPETGRLYLGSSDGKIYLMDEGYSYNNQDYLSYLETGWNNFGKTIDGKAATKNCRITAEVSEDTDIDFNFLKKYEQGPVASDQQTITFGNFDARYNQTLYDEKFYNIGLAQTKELYISGVFDELNIQMKVRDADVAFKLRDINLEAEIPNE